jgi:hypothetical protein
MGFWWPRGHPDFGFWIKVQSKIQNGVAWYNFLILTEGVARLKILDDVIVRALQNMTSDERRDLILGVVDKLLLQMSASERGQLMEHVVDHFLDALPNEERVGTVRELVPRLLAQLMQSGGMNVDELLWAAMGSLGALEQTSTQPLEPGEESPGKGI